MDKTRENRLRREAERAGYRLIKGRGAQSITNQKEYALIDVTTSHVVVGTRFDADMDTIEAFLHAPKAVTVATAGATAQATDDGAKPYCRFCGKGKDDVETLYASPDYKPVTHICDECVTQGYFKQRAKMDHSALEEELKAIFELVKSGWDETDAAGSENFLDFMIDISRPVHLNEQTRDELMDRLRTLSRGVYTPKTIEKFHSLFSRMQRWLSGFPDEDVENRRSWDDELANYYSLFVSDDPADKDAATAQAMAEAEDDATAQSEARLAELAPLIKAAAMATRNQADSPHVPEFNRLAAEALAIVTTLNPKAGPKGLQRKFDKYLSGIKVPGIAGGITASMVAAFAKGAS